MAVGTSRTAGQTITAADVNAIAVQANLADGVSFWPQQMVIAGVAASGFITTPGVVVSRGDSIGSVEVRAHYPPLGGSLVTVVSLIGTARTVVGTVTLAAGQRRGLLSALSVTPAVGDELRAEVTGVGGSYGGGQGLSVTVVGAGVTLPAVGSAPGSVTGLASSTSGAAITLSWTAVAGATEYLVTRDGTPIGYSSSTSFVDSTPEEGVTYTYGVSGANRDRVGAESTVTASALAVADYSGAEVIADPDWTLAVSSGSGSSVVAGSGADATSSVWSIGTTGVQANDISRVIRTGAAVGPAVSLLNPSLRIRYRFQSTGGGWQLNARQNGSTDTVRLRVQVEYAQVRFSYRRPADGAQTELAATAFAHNTTGDFFAELVVTDTRADVFVWPVSSARPGSPTVSFTDAAVLGALPAGNVSVRNYNFTGGTTARVHLLREVRVVA